MAFSFIAASSATGTGVTSLSCNRPAGISAGDFIAAIYAFQGVASGSGPWIIPNIGQFTHDYIGPVSGWQQACWTAPAATGVGIEVWVAVHGSGSTAVAQFAAAENVVTVESAYSGEYNPTGNISSAMPRVATTARVTGNLPAAPSVDANAGELVIALAGDTMSASGFGTPSGFTSRIDVARAGAGSVEAAIADAVALVAGATGPVTFPEAASSTTAQGTTATLAVMPAPGAATAGAVIDAPLPENLDIGAGYTIRVTALNPDTGALMAGVNVDTAVLTADQASVNPGSGGGTSGDWFLVPGPGA